MEHKFIAASNFFSEVKKSVYLYEDKWKEGTTTLIRASRDIDKTAKAFAIASDLAKSGREVLYVNAEEHIDRYAGKSVCCDNLYIFTPEYESIDDTTDYADLVFEAIEHAIRTTSIRTFVIDSVSRIAALSFGRNASVAYIMKRLVALQVKCRLSLLVVADSATRVVNNALVSLAATEITVGETDRSEQPMPSRMLSTQPELTPPASTLTQLSRADRRRAEKLARKLRV